MAHLAWKVIGKENEQTTKELAHEVLDIVDTGSDITDEPLPEDDSSQCRPILLRAKAELNWVPEIHLIERLEKTISYIESSLS
jgi:nucleoside-diphosphate-sugar epimerase